MNAAHVATDPWEYSDFIDVLRKKEPRLAEELATFTGIEHVLQWMQKLGLVKPPVDTVGQDEFSWDFLLQWDPAGRWLAFGVT